METKMTKQSYKIFMKKKLLTYVAKYLQRFEQV